MRNNIHIEPKLTSLLTQWVLNRFDNENIFDDFPDHPTGYIRCIDYIHDKKDKLVSNGFSYDNLEIIHKELLMGFGFDINLPIEENMGIMICYSSKGHRAHPHLDTNFNSEGKGWEENRHIPNEFVGDVIHTRFNILLSKPTKGGNPIIQDIEYNVDENEGWMCVSGVKEHATTEVEGDKPRIMLSFGHWVPKEELLERGMITHEELNNLS